MSFTQDVFLMIADHYSRFPYSTKEGRVISLSYMSYGVEKKSVYNAIHVLINAGLIKCIYRMGSAHWNIAYRKGTTAEIIPTKFALRLIKKNKLEEFFIEKCLV